MFLGLAHGLGMGKAFGALYNPLATSLLALMVNQPPLGSVVFDESELAGDARPIQAGRCYKFDGLDDYVISPTSATNSIGTNDFEISANVNFDDATNAYSGIMLGIDAGLNAKWIFRLNGNFRLQFYVAAGSQFSQSNTGTLGTALNDGEWHNVRVARVGDDLSFYIDGVLDYTVSGWGSVDASNSVGLVLASGSYSSFRAKASMSDVSLSIGGSIAAHYKCDEAAGTTAYDSSGNGNHGTITNATLSTFHATDIDVPYSWQNEGGYSEGRNTFNSSASLTNWTAQGSSLAVVQDHNGNSNSALRLTNSATNELHRAYHVRTGTLTDDYLVLRFNPSNSGGFVSWQFTNSTNYSVYNVATGTWGYAGSTATHISTEDIGGGYYETIFKLDMSQPFIVLQIACGLNGLTGPSFVGTGQSVDIAIQITDDPAKVYLATNNQQIFDAKIPRDEATPTQDVLGNPLQYTGRVPYNAAVVQSGCATFNGAGIHAKPANDIMDSYDDVISMWIKASADGTQTLINQPSNGAGGIVYLYKGRLFVANEGSNNSQGFGDYNSLNTGVWSFLEIHRNSTLNQTVVKLNGVTAPLSGTGVFSASGGATLCGRGGTGFTYNGSMCNFKVTNNGTTKLHYKMSEGGGGILYDSSPNANHATIYNHTSATFWGVRQDVYSANIGDGFSGQLLSIGVPNGGIRFNEEVSFTTLCLNFGSPQNNGTASTGVFMKSNSVPHLGIHTDGRIYAGTGYDGDVGFTYDTDIGAMQNIIFEKSSVSGKMKVYKNGIFTGESSSDFPDISIRTLNEGWGSTAQGIYRDVMFYDRELTAQEKLDVAAGNYPDNGLTNHFTGSGADVSTAYIDKVGSITATQYGSTAPEFSRVPAANGIVADGTNLTSPAGAWHNGAESKFRVPEAPALRQHDNGSFLFSGDSPNDISYADIVANIGDQIFADTSTTNKKSILVFPDVLTGTDLTNAENFTNQ